MTKEIAAKVDDQFLTSDSAYSDRFVYSNYFVPLLPTFNSGSDVPMIPFYTKDLVLEAIVAGVLSEDSVMEALEELKIDELWSENSMDEALGRVKRGVNAERRRLESAVDGGNGADGGDMIDRGDVAERAEVIDGGEGRAVAVRERRLAHQPNAALLTMLAERQAEAHRPTVLEDQQAEVVAGLLRSTVGYAFLDRTRIRPAGFAIGEHVYALGLAPSEEVILEQKTFTKKQTSFEEQSEQETQLDIEFSSTYTTELEEGLDHQHSLTDTWGLGVSHTGSYESPWTTYGKFNGSHTISYSKNVTDAHQESSRRSVKDGRTSSSKVSGRYRAQHKTTFKVSKEEGFESTSKRTIRNPNRATPITLHYFKVLQRLEMTQERYGARLCWAPAVSNPARSFLEKIRAGRQQILDAAVAALPKRPDEPSPPSGGAGESTTTRQQKTFTSELTEAGQHSWTNGQSSDYDVDVPIDEGWSWDGDVNNITIDFSSLRPADTYSGYRTGIPVMVDGKLRVRVHVGAGERPWAPPIFFQVTVNCVKDVVVPPLATQDAAYQASLEDWRARVKEWEDARATALEEAEAAADAFEKETRDKLSPVNEMISQIIESKFEPAMRDDAWEIEFWQRLFDWERASFQTFPSWWSSDAMPDPTLDPSDYMNASWAKLYLPVRPGMELAALRWIFGKSIAKPVDAKSEKAFAGIVSDLEKFRKGEFGSADEQPDLKQACQEVGDDYACMAKWHELLPTDGTHIEVVQSATTAADADTRAEIDAAAELRKALNESEKRDAKIKDKAIDKMTAAAKLDVHVGADGGADVTQ